MRNFRLVLASSVLVLSALSTLSCGSSSRQLQSISISPASASGQAQFVATGTYADGSKASPLTALWSPGNPWVKSLAVAWAISVDQHGVASCLSTPGTYQVDATAPVDPNVSLSQMGMNTPQVSGTAQLICP